MKFVYISIILVAIAGCNSKPGASKEAARQVLKKGPLMDSVFVPDFKKLLQDDSFELLAVTNTIEGKMHDEEILYIDHKIADNQEEMVSTQKGSAEIFDQMKKGHLIISDTIRHIPNPYHDMNAIYRPIFKYKGRLIYCDEEGMCYPQITDNSLIMMCQGFDNWAFLSASRADNRTTYKIWTGTAECMLEIKKIGGEFDLQVWRWTGRWDNKGIEYELRIPIEKGHSSINIPKQCRNTGRVPHVRDKINYDSLWLSK